MDRQNDGDERASSKPVQQPRPELDRRKD
jgi:hypothetical protein